MEKYTFRTFKSRIVQFQRRSGLEHLIPVASVEPYRLVYLGIVEGDTPSKLAEAEIHIFMKNREPELCHSVKYGLLERNAGIDAGVRKIPTVLMIITDCFVAKHRPGEIRIFVENSSAERCSARELGSKKLHIAMKFGIVKICPSRDRPPPVTPLRKLGNLCSSEVEVAALQLSLYFLSEGFSLVLRPVADWVMNHTVPPPAMLTGSIVGLAPVDWAPQLAPAWLEVNPASAFLEALTDSRLHRL